MTSHTISRSAEVKITSIIEDLHQILREVANEHRRQSSSRSPSCVSNSSRDKPAWIVTYMALINFSVFDSRCRAISRLPNVLQLVIDKCCRASADFRTYSGWSYDRPCQICLECASSVLDCTSRDEVQTPCGLKHSRD